MTSTFLYSIIALSCTLLGAIIGFFTFARNRDKDVKHDASELAVIRTKLDTINQAVITIAADIKIEEQETKGINERLIRFEESHKILHNRLNRLEEMIDVYLLKKKEK